MRFVCCVVAFAVILVLARPSAQQSRDAFTVYGAGTAPCASWTEHLKNPDQHATDLQWVLGFVSAAGVFAGVQLKIDGNGIAPFISKYCQEHPQETITTAAANLIGSPGR